MKKKPSKTTLRSSSKTDFVPLDGSRLSNKIFTALEWLLLLCPFLFGCFFSWASAAVSVILLLLLLLLLRRGLLCSTRSAPFLAAASIVLFHLGGIFWGTDRGMALIGAVQFLPLPLFVLLLEQYTPEQRMGLLRRMPYAASAMAVLSVLSAEPDSVPGETGSLSPGGRPGFSSIRTPMRSIFSSLSSWCSSVPRSVLGGFPG